MQDKPKIKINDDIYLTSDNNNWIVTYWRDGINKKTNSPSRTSRNKYFSSLGAALGSIVDESLKEVETARALLLVLNNTKEEIMQALKEHLTQKQ
jgi:hypothetical protein